MKKEMRARMHLRRKTVVIITTLSLFLLQATAFAESSSGQFSSGIAGVPVSSQSDYPEPAEPKITKDEAVAKVRSLFPLLQNVQVQDVQLGNRNSFPPGNQNVWTIQWNYTKGNNGYGFSSTVDSLTGELLQTSISYPFDEGNEVYYPPKVSKDEALKLAKDFIHKAAPALSPDRLKPMEQMNYNNQSLFGPVRYDFNFTISVNGITTTGESLYLSLDGNGQIISYNRNKMAADYPSAVPKVSMKEAGDKYEEAADLALQYIPVYHYSTREKTWFLGWAPFVQGDLTVDAQTGEFLNSFGEVFQPKDVKYIDIPTTDSVFTPIAGTGEDSLLTPDQAAAAVEKAIRIPEGRKLSSSMLDTNNRGFWDSVNGKVWRLNWTEQPTGPGSYPLQTMASVDARTGQLLDFNVDSFRPPWQQSQDKTEPVKNPISKEQAKGKAMQLINQLYPNAREELKWLDPDPNTMTKEPSGAFPFVFQRVYQGKPVVDDSVRLSLDASGQLLSYNASRSDGFEESAKSLTATVSKDKAAVIYRDQTSQLLQYRVYGGFYSERDYVKPTVKLVYSRQTMKDTGIARYVLDAANGQWRTTFVNPDAPGEGPMAYPKDITGHWAQKDLETMVQYQILKVDSSAMLKPDAAITLGDWMNMMAFAVNPNFASMFDNRETTNASDKFRDVDAKSPYYASAQWFIQNKWLDPVKTPVLKPEQPLTRETLAESLVSIMKYDKLARYLQQPLIFKDANQIADKGAVTLAVSLGLFSRDTTMFHPKQKVTKAQAATVLMKLVRLQGKIDQRIMY